MKVGLILQARNGSSRFPGKMIHSFMGRRVIDWMFIRCQKVDVDLKILATSTLEEDDSLAEAGKEVGWTVFRGSPTNVLSRFSTITRKYKLDTVIRLTGDCVLMDYRLVNEALSEFIHQEADYLTLDRVMDGFDVEVMKAEHLLRAELSAKLPSEQEHVTPWIRKSSRLKRVFHAYGSGDFLNVHLSLDRREDVAVLHEIYEKLGPDDIKYEEVIDLIRKEPSIIDPVRELQPNAGAETSYEEDRRFIRALKAQVLCLEESLRHRDEALKVIPNASQTFSKSSMQFSSGVSPLFAREGRGAMLIDLDGNSYIDYTMGLGPAILGYAFEPVLQELRTQLSNGLVFTLPHFKEKDLADLLVQTIPSAEMVRFGKNGSDVTAASVRLARAYTGRDVIACCGYHGWQDWYIGSTSRSMGIPESVRELTVPFDYNDLNSLKSIFENYSGRVAAVIMEPVGLEAPQEGFLEKVKELCHQKASVLIFDEVVTGYRFALGGAQSFFNVIPDLSCFGKAMANGMPISALVGRRELMMTLNETFFSTTFGGELLSITAAISTLSYMKEHGVIETLWAQGRRLKEGISGMIHEKEMEEIVSIDGYPVRSVLNFSGEEALIRKTLFQQECARRGVLFTGAHNVSLPHDDVIIKSTLTAYDQVLDILKYSIEYALVEALIEGEPLEPIFRSY